MTPRKDLRPEPSSSLPCLPPRTGQFPKALGGGPRTVVVPPPPGWAQVSQPTLDQHPPGPAGASGNPRVSEGLTTASLSWRRSCPLRVPLPALLPRGSRLCPHRTRWMASPAVPSAGPGPGAPIVLLSSAIRATSRSSLHCPYSKVSPTAAARASQAKLQGVGRSVRGSLDSPFQAGTPPSELTPTPSPLC